MAKGWAFSTKVSSSLELARSSVPLRAPSFSNCAGSRSTGTVSSAVLTFAVTSLVAALFVSYDFPSVARADSAGGIAFGAAGNRYDLQNDQDGAYIERTRGQELGDYRFGFVRSRSNGSRGAGSKRGSDLGVVRPHLVSTRVRATLTPEQRASYNRTRVILSQLGELRPYDAFRKDSHGRADFDEAGARFGEVRPTAEPDRVGILNAASDGYFSRESSAGSFLARLSELFNPDPFGYQSRDMRNRISNLQGGGRPQEHSVALGMLEALDSYDNGDYSGALNRFSYELVEGTYSLVETAASLVFPVSTAHADYPLSDLSPDEVRTRLEQSEHSYQRDGLARF